MLVRRALLCAVVFACAAPAVSLAASKSDIGVVSSRLLYLPDQIGGKYHTLTYVLLNQSNVRAEGVGGQASIYSPSGRLIKTVRFNPVNIPAGGIGVLSDIALDLPVANKNDQLEVRFFKRVQRFRKAPRGTPSFELTDVRYSKARKGGFDFYSCRVVGVVTKTTKGRAAWADITVATSVGGRVVSSSSDDVEDLETRLPQTFEVEFVSPSECPAEASDVKLFLHVDDFFS